MSMSESQRKRIAVQKGEPLHPTDAIETNAAGGKQSKIGRRADLLDGEAMDRLTRVLAEGAAKYGDNNWRKIGRASHLNHALTHCFNALALMLRSPNAAAIEEELDHAFCRLMMSIASS